MGMTDMDPEKLTGVEAAIWANAWTWSRIHGVYQGNSWRDGWDEVEAYRAERARRGLDREEEPK